MNGMETKAAPKVPEETHRAGAGALCVPSLCVPEIPLRGQARPGQVTAIGKAMNCRPGCGACCIAPSISSLDKAAGQSCAYLTPDFRCSIFAGAQRPACCAGLQPSVEMCGSDRGAALIWLANLETATKPPETGPDS